VRRAKRYPTAASEATSVIMRSNYRRDTGPEERVRALLWRARLRYRKDFAIRVGSTRTRPDVAFPGRRIAVFIDGCFWHACPRHGTDPRHNAWYWGPKLLRNRSRDRAVTRALRGAGWTVLRFWEHVPAEQAAAAILGHHRRRSRADARCR
jgi:DNA mismatch endonuclease (patch repair protein)